MTELEDARFFRHQVHIAIGKRTSCIATVQAPILTFITAKDGSYRTGNVKFNVRKRTASKTVKRKRTVFYRCRIIKIG